MAWRRQMAHPFLLLNFVHDLHGILTDAALGGLSASPGQVMEALGDGHPISGHGVLGLPGASGTDDAARQQAAPD